jgi:hypothetical protein
MMSFGRLLVFPIAEDANNSDASVENKKFRGKPVKSLFMNVRILTKFGSRREFVKRASG